jgi:hypothetical protein
MYIPDCPRPGRHRRDLRRPAPDFRTSSCDSSCRGRTTWSRRSTPTTTSTGRAACSWSPPSRGRRSRSRRWRARGCRTSSCGRRSSRRRSRRGDPGWQSRTGTTRTTFPKPRRPKKKIVLHYLHTYIIGHCLNLYAHKLFMYNESITAKSAFRGIHT